MRCVIIAGSPDTNADFVRQTVKKDDYVICADNGCLYALNAGVAVNLVVGDFDSCLYKIFPDCETIELDTHKDDTDTMHAIDIAIERGYRQIVILGATGGRVDHTFANISALQYIADKGAEGCLLSESEYIEYISVGKHNYNGNKGKTFSLFPFGCKEVCVSYSGAEYPLNKYRISSKVPLGVSNKFISEKSVIDIYDGNAIVIINLKEC